MRDALKALARALATAAVSPALISFAIRRRLARRRPRPRRIDAGARADSRTARRLSATRVSLARAGALRPIRDGAVRHDLQPGRRADRRERLRRAALSPRARPPRARRAARGRRARAERVAHARHRRSRSPDSRAGRGRDRWSASAKGTWMGSAAVVLADVGQHCVVGAGAVVTSPIPDYAVAAGVPARVIRSRRPAPARA